ncbi:hypothetical protein K438DRAFT_1910525 [Mycena galopus ATCC 62051]|nr:hypothetical protein K438DRAFT_1910525 [Mycena galopus ATCC 62051]
MSSSPYGTWKSSITAQNITQGSVKLTDVVVDRVTSTVYHVESRPSEGGRGVLVESRSGRDLVGKPWNVRTGVHEYGVAYFSHFIDGRVYAVDVAEGNEPRAVTPESKVLRFANFDVHPKHPHLLVSILEDHSDSSSPTSVVNTLCIINTKSQSLAPLVSGADFYASAKFSPDGTRIVWQQWFLPDMPWQGAEILVADVLVETDKLEIRNTLRIAGQKTTHSVSYPFWATDATLVFTSDQSGYQNPWKYDLEASPVFSEPLNQDFGEPAWVLGRFPYAIIEDGRRALFSAFQDGRSVLHMVDIANGTRRLIDNSYVGIHSMQAASKDKVVFIGERVDAAPELVLCLISVAQPMTLKAGPDDHPVHILYYPPLMLNILARVLRRKTSMRAICPRRSHKLHRTCVGYDDPVLYLPGWAWVSAYGRAYIERLAGKWGIVDIEDCIQAAKIISHAPYSLVDPKRIVIRGGSAGGFTALGAVSMVRIGLWSWLMGGTNAEIPEVYKERSPVTHADSIVSPLLILQGDLDRVVPKEQAEGAYFESIQRRGGKVEYKLYPGEGHGWRKEENMIDALERELAFYEAMLMIK